MTSEQPRVLDMGCGAGHLARLLADRGLTQYVGFDFSAKRLEQARELVPEFRFEVADVYETTLFETVDYTTVVCTEFLEHLEGDLEILARGTPGTRLLGTVPNYDADGHVRFFDTRARSRIATVRASERSTSPRSATRAKTREWLVDGILA